jgi:hypothetical protein
MGSGPPSTTTAPGTPPRGELRLPGARRAPAFLIVALLLFFVACSQTQVPAQSGDRLAADTTYVADLDGDGTSESIRVDGGANSLTITDGDTVYHSRNKWRVVEAALGDTDRDGLLEVVTLLDSDDGRHLGLFAFFGGEYRERLVTSELTPRPLSLRVLPGDLLELTEELPPGQEETQAVRYHWNGFGFTAMDPADSL